MLRVLRITLMWLIALSVPIQGSAAVTMFGCSPGHHRGIESPQLAMAHQHAKEPGAQSGRAVTEAVQRHHHEGDLAHDHSRSPEAQGEAHKVAEGHCTPCASCGVVAALPATVIRFEPAPMADFFVLSTQCGVTSFLADGLERPPRLLLV